MPALNGERIRVHHALRLTVIKFPAESLALGLGAVTDQRPRNLPSWDFKLSNKLSDPVRRRGTWIDTGASEPNLRGTINSVAWIGANGPFRGRKGRAFVMARGPSGSGRAGTRSVGATRADAVDPFVAREANGYKAEGFSRLRDFFPIMMNSNEELSASAIGVASPTPGSSQPTPIALSSTLLFIG